LIDYVVSQGYQNEWYDQNGAGNALKTCRQIGSPLSGNCNTTEHPRWDENYHYHGFDAFGFSANPGGYRPLYDAYLCLGTEGFWWSSSEYDSWDAWSFNMSFSNSKVYRNYFNKRFGWSVRCVRDND